jgi:hypothetical protein
LSYFRFCDSEALLRSADRISRRLCFLIKGVVNPDLVSLALDNSALFLGVLSDTPNIQRLVFSSSEPGRAFGINTLSINAASVPEPGSVLALSLFGLGAIASRKKRAKASP